MNRFLCPKTKVSTLSNGLKVASIESPGHYVSLGVYCSVGSRIETASTSGSCHLLERMAFKSTSDYTSDEIVASLELAGGKVQGQASREMVMVQASIFPTDIARIFKVLGQITTRPKFLSRELDEAKHHSEFEVSQFMAMPDNIMEEAMHSVAYTNGKSPSNLGRPCVLKSEYLPLLNADSLRSFHKTWYTPNRLALVGVGIPHDQLTDLASTHFQMDPVSKEMESLQKSLWKPATYTGGVSIIDTMGKKSNNPDDLDLTHYKLAFEAPPAMHPDSYAVHTLASLMGGGGSFSAGGPGKGMYSRLYTRLLNRWGWLENCNAQNVSYSDSGLFVFSASVHPAADTHKYALDVFCQQFAEMAGKITDEELDRAKNQLMSNLLMSLEAKVTEAEDIGRQVLSFGKRMDTLVMVDRIKQVTKEDIVRVSRNMLYGESTPGRSYDDEFTTDVPPTGTGKPTLVVRGPLMRNDPLYKAEDTLKRWGFGSNPGVTERARRLFR